jgi:hypothetical protein
VEQSHDLCRQCVRLLRRGPGRDSTEPAAIPLLQVTRRQQPGSYAAVEHRAVEGSAADRNRDLAIGGELRERSDESVRAVHGVHELQRRHLQVDNGCQHRERRP